jgi:hypothetical protein
MSEAAKRAALWRKKNPIRMKWLHKRHDASKKNIPFKLSMGDYKKLLQEANISPDDVAPAGYHLARYNDTGPYEYGNCRFVYYVVNVAEKKISDKHRAAAARNMKAIRRTKTREDLSRAGSKGGGSNRLKQDEVDSRVCAIESSGIDLTKLGWVKKVSVLLKINSSTVHKFMRKYYPHNFYDKSKAK